VRSRFDLASELDHLPPPHEDIEFALWNRGGATAEVLAQPHVRVFTPADML